MRRRQDPAIRDALDRIAEEDERNQLRPDVVLERARSAKSPLHRCFTWEDDEAGEKWRLHEARNLINAYYVVIEQQPIPLRTRAYVSLKSERVAGGGYTPIRRVLSEPERYTELLQNAKDDLDAMARRYGHLRELKPLFTLWHHVRRRLPKAKAKAVHAAA